MRMSVSVRNYRVILFVLFAVGTFVRPVLFLLHCFGLNSGIIVFTLNLVFSPQPFVFTDDIYYWPAYVCQEKLDSERVCFTANEFMGELIPEPYFLSGVVINHDIISFLKYPDQELTRKEMNVALGFLCEANVHRVLLSRIPISKSPGSEGVYHFECPI